MFSLHNSPLVSIITPTCNSADFIKHTIDSILAQTMTDWELLLVDDASQDATVKILQQYASADQRITVIIMDQNGGAARARNAAIERACGRYIAFCDSDDTWAPTKLERQVGFMQQRKCALSYTSYYRCREDGTPYREVHCPAKVTYRQECRYNSIACLTAMYDSEQTGKVFMPLLRKRQDWGLWIKVLERCAEGEGLDEPLAYYRRRKGSLSKGRLSTLRGNLLLFRQVLGFSWPHALFHYLFFTLPKKL